MLPNGLSSPLWDIVLPVPRTRRCGDRRRCARVRRPGGRVLRPDGRVRRHHSQNYHPDVGSLPRIMVLVVAISYHHHSRPLRETRRWVRFQCCPC